MIKKIRLFIIKNKNLFQQSSFQQYNRPSSIVPISALLFFITFTHKDYSIITTTKVVKNDNNDNKKFKKDNDSTNSRNTKDASSSSSSSSSNIWKSLLPSFSFLKRFQQKEGTAEDYSQQHDDCHFEEEEEEQQQQQQQRMSFLSPTLPIHIFHMNSNLEIAFDVRTRNPLYVLEKNIAIELIRRNNNNNNNNETQEEEEEGQQHTNNNKNRRLRFTEEKLLPEEYRSRSSHYKYSGYDRGHMAPAADFPNHKDDTYTLCNVSPQIHSMNVSIWSKLERWIRKVAIREYNNEYDNDGRRQTHVITGPLWLPTTTTTVTGTTRQQDLSSPSTTKSTTNERLIKEESTMVVHNNSDNNRNIPTEGQPRLHYSYPTIGRPPSLVSVPTHFYKVVVVTTTTNNDDIPMIRKFACFVVPNVDIAVKKDQQKTLSLLENYVVSWKDLETVSGLQFFPILTSRLNTWDDTTTTLTNEVRELFQKKQKINSKHSQQTIKQLMTLDQQDEGVSLLLTGGSLNDNATPKSHKRKKKKKNQLGNNDSGSCGSLEHLCKGGFCHS